MKALWQVSCLHYVTKRTDESCGRTAVAPDRTKPVFARCFTPLLRNIPMKQKETDLTRKLVLSLMTVLFSVGHTKKSFEFIADHRFYS